MKINWKVRFKNKPWLLSMLLLCITFVYNVLGMFDIMPPISQDLVVELTVTIVNLLVVIGVVVDPTTPGLTDSDQAMTYERSE